jgi:peptidoglycan/xylan/chitin deacetylase (PgdA/CDA1 family)
MPRKAFALLVPALLAAALATSAPAADAAPLTVTLGFDDGYADQTRAADILGRDGMTATYFLISGLLDRPGRLTTAQALALQTAGNEIGGHTVDHPFLSQLTTAQQRTEICADREALAAKGFAVRSLAYPHGDYSAETEQIAAGCGYASARTIDGIGCGSGCVPAESLAPLDPFATRAYTTNATTTLQRLEGLVTGAEPGGGWLQLVFHHVCDPVEGCGPDTVTPATLGALADWLAGERAAARVQVRTTAQAVGGPVAPVVPSASVAPVTLPNGSLEDGTGALPACWTGTGFGTSTATFTRVADARTGTRAVRVDMTAWTSGDRKLITTMDGGTCAPRVVPGRRYTLRAGYKSASAPRLLAYYRSTSGAWVFLGKSAPLPGATGYRVATWTTPPMPADATAVSVGMLLDRVGTVTLDDFGLVDSAFADLLPNGSLEADSDHDSLSDCTQRTVLGTSIGAFARSAVAPHAGAFAETLSLTSLTSGDRKVLTSFDAACAPPASPGHGYLAGAWYRSDAPVRVVLYYRDAAGVWRFWAKSAPKPPSAAWAAATLHSPPAPADATALATGLLLDSLGTASVDDLSLADTG